MSNEPTLPDTTDPVLAARLERLAASRQPSSTTSARPSGAPRSRSRRQHPSKGSRAASLGLSLAATGALSALFALHPATASVASAATNGSAAGGSSASGASTAAATGGSTAVTGSADSNRWGVVQVEAVFGSDGSLTAVNVLQSPDSEGKSVSINQRATPILTSEALAAQSAKVDTVSGATYTSDSYARSLQAAIDSARASGVTTIS
jgi:uncharacterized protein with FMN-binding domain